MNDRLYDTELRGVSDIKEANINLIYAGRARTGYLAATSEQERKALRKQFDDAVQTMDKLRDRAGQTFQTDEGKRLLAQFIEIENTWKREAQDFFSAAQSQALTQTDAAVKEIEKRVVVSSQKLDDLMTDLAVSKEKAAAVSVQAGTDLYERMRALMITLAVLGVAIGMLLGWLVTRGIVRPLQQAVNAARQVAAGDLTTDIKVATRDETGDLMGALKEMNESLARIVRDVRDGCEHRLGVLADRAGHSDLSQRTEEQASSLEETAASMEELTSTVQQECQQRQPGRPPGRARPRPWRCAAAKWWTAWCRP